MTWWMILGLSIAGYALVVGLLAYWLGRSRDKQATPCPRCGELRTGVCSHPTAVCNGWFGEQDG